MDSSETETQCAFEHWAERLMLKIDDELICLEEASGVAKARRLRKSGFEFGQVIKGARWMPRRRKAMKDVASCDKPRGAAN